MRTQEKYDAALAKVRKRHRKGYYIEMQVETDFTKSLVFLTPMEAERLGNALIKAAQPKQKKESGK